MPRGEKPLATSTPTNRRYQNSMDKQTYSGAPVYIGADWTARREAKLKCSNCLENPLMNCSLNPVGCMKHKAGEALTGTAMYAYSRVGSLADGGLS